MTDGASLEASVTADYTAAAAGDIDNDSGVGDAVFTVDNGVDFDASAATGTNDGLTITAAGNADASILEGTDQDDVITGGDGADTLTGGAGDDVFSYAATTDFGDTITDFGETGTDLVQLDVDSGSNLFSAAATSGTGNQQFALNIAVGNGTQTTGASVGTIALPTGSTSVSLGNDNILDNDGSGFGSADAFVSAVTNIEGASAQTTFVALGLLTNGALVAAFANAGADTTLTADEVTGTTTIATLQTAGNTAVTALDGSDLIVV